MGWRDGGGADVLLRAPQGPLEPHHREAVTVKITVEQITSDPPYLRLGCVIRGDKSSWVRFCQLRVEFKALPAELPRQLLEMRDYESGEDHDDDPLPLEY